MGGWMCGREAGAMGQVASQRWALTAIRPQTVVLCSQHATEMYTNHRIDRDSHWQQPAIQPILISTLQWPNRPCNAPRWPYRVGKKPSVKARLAIYSHAVDASGQCMSVSVLCTVRIFHTIRVRYVPYTYGMFFCTRRVWLYRTRILFHIA